MRSRGNNPEAALNQSTQNSWPGLFEVRDGQQTRGQQRQKRNLEAIREGLRRARSKVAGGAVQKEVPGPTRGLTGESGRSSSVPRKATTSFSLRSP